MCGFHRCYLSQHLAKQLELQLHKYLLWHKLCSIVLIQSDFTLFIFFSVMNDTTEGTASIIYFYKKRTFLIKQCNINLRERPWLECSNIALDSERRTFFHIATSAPLCKGQICDLQFSLRHKFQQRLEINKTEVVHQIQFLNTISIMYL